MAKRRNRNANYQDPVNIDEQNAPEEGYVEYGADYDPDENNGYDPEPEDEQDDPEEQPGLLKRIGMGAWKWIKRLAPLGLAYGAGFATKAYLTNRGSNGAPTAPGIQGSDTPAIPMKTETVTLDDGSKVEVTEF